MPQPEGSLWAVGYAPGYSAVEDGMGAARRDAYSRLRADRQRILEGEKLYESVPGFRQSLEGTRFAERGLPDTLRSVAYLDSANASGMTLVLAAWTPEGDAPESFLKPPDGRKRFAPNPPAWVQDGAKGGRDEAGGSRAAGRAVGQAPRYYYLQNSWRQAEARVRRQLAFQVTSKIERLEKSAEDWRHSVTAIKTGAYLRNVQTLARWADEKTCYVLVEGTADGVPVE
jgi:hypothetical protein